MELKERLAKILKTKYGIETDADLSGRWRICQNLISAYL